MTSGENQEFLHRFLASAIAVGVSGLPRRSGGLGVGAERIVVSATKLS